VVAEGRRRRGVVRRVPPPWRRGGGRREGVAAVVPAAVPVEEVPPIRRRRRHPRGRCRPQSGAFPQLRPPPQITYALRRSQLDGLVIQGVYLSRVPGGGGAGRHRAQVLGVLRRAERPGGCGDGVGKELGRRAPAAGVEAAGEMGTARRPWPEEQAGRRGRAGRLVGGG